MVSEGRMEMFMRVGAPVTSFSLGNSFLPLPFSLSSKHGTKSALLAVLCGSLESWDADKFRLFQCFKGQSFEMSVQLHLKFYSQGRTLDMNAIWVIRTISKPSIVRYPCHEAFL